MFPNKTNTEFQKYLISTTSPPPAFRIREIGSFRDSFIWSITLNEWKGNGDKEDFIRQR